MNNVKPVDSCLKCNSDENCRVVGGSGLFITIKCQCGCTWNTLNVHALPKKKQNPLPLPQPKQKPVRRWKKEERNRFSDLVRQEFEKPIYESTWMM